MLARPANSIHAARREQGKRAVLVALPMTNGSDDAPTDPTTQQQLLRQWEERIDEAHGDPMAALAELLGARQAARN